MAEQGIAARAHGGRTRGAELAAWAAAGLAALAWHVYSVTALPIVISPDGFGYLHLSGRLFSAGAGWDSARVPLYPLSLRLAIAAFGFDGATLVGLNSALALLGSLLLALAVRASFGVAPALALFLLLCAYPPNVAYAHAVLTESGQYAFVAALALVSSLRASEARRGEAPLAAAALGLLTVAFLWRQNLLLLAPAIALCFALATRRDERRSAAAGPPAGRGDGASRLLYRYRSSLALLLAPLPVLLAWRAALDQPDADLREGRAAHLYGALLQGLPPVDSPEVDPIRERYRAALRDAPRGEVPLHGIQGSGFWEMLQAFQASTIRPKELFWELARRHPDRYLAGAGRTAGHLLGIESSESNVKGMCERVLVNDRDFLVTRWPIDYRPEAVRFVITLLSLPHPGRPYASAAQALRHAIAPFRRLIMLGGLAACGFALLSVVRLDPRYAWLGVLPLAELAPYALLLMSDDRYAYPVHGLFLANAVVATTLGWRLTRARRWRRSRQGSGSGMAQRLAKTAPAQR